jgi:hypothetical protein
MKVMLIKIEFLLASTWCWIMSELLNPTESSQPTIMPTVYRNCDRDVLGFIIILFVAIAIGLCFGLYINGTFRRFCRAN